MNTIREILALLGKTLLVTLAVAGGFILGGMIGIPDWLQVVCLIPAGFLFFRLSGDPFPPKRRWVPYAVAIAGVASLMSFANGLLQSHFPSLYGSFWPHFLLFYVAIIPVRAFAALIERHWPFGAAETSSETRTP